MDEHVHAGAKTALEIERIEGGEEDLWDRRGLFDAHAFGDGHELAFMGEEEAGHTATRRDAHDAIARLKSADIGANALDAPRKLKPWDICGCARRRGVEASPLQDICAIHPGRADGDSDLSA